MSREIKFRYVFKRKTDGHIYIIEFSIEALEDKSVSQIKTMLRNDLWKLVARDQFTGLNDFYEGDIVETDSIEGVGVIKFEKDCASFVVNFHAGCWDSIEVATKKIGNIHENKDLLP